MLFPLRFGFVFNERANWFYRQVRCCCCLSTDHIFQIVFFFLSGLLPIWFGSMCRLNVKYKNSFCILSAVNWICAHTYITRRTTFTPFVCVYVTGKTLICALFDSNRERARREEKSEETKTVMAKHLLVHRIFVAHRKFSLSCSASLAIYVCTMRTVVFFFACDSKYPESVCLC